MEKRYLSILLLITSIALAKNSPIAPSAKEEMNITTSSGIITLPSGLRYQVLTKGADHAQSPKIGQQVTVHYTGYLNEGHDELGKKFDSSVDRGQPFVFKLGVGYVIKGWDEGVALMKKGQKVRFFIPASLGYGARGAGSVIPPHADLIFDVELIDFK
jgi:peptidylprolyl isomerase